MKRFFILLYMMSCALLNILASDPIDFVPHPKNEQGQGNRVPALLPTADYEDNIINVYVPYDIEDMQIVIKDEQGGEIFSALIPSVSIQYSIILSEDESADKHSIELYFNGWHLIGYF